jgi:hypothetical protein
MKRALTLVVTCLALSAQAQVYNYLSFRMMSTADHPFNVYIDSRQSQPAGLGVGLVQHAIEQGWQAWNEQTCAQPKVHSMGLTGSTVPRADDPYDTFSVMGIWVTSPSDADYDAIVGGAFVTAITLPLAYSGVLQTCDIYFNAVDFQWSVDDTTPATALDVQSVAVHEEGHCLGLDHQSSGTVMAQQVSPGLNRRALTTIDVDALCQKNPAAGAPAAPCNADGGCNDASLRCLTQQASNQPALQLCSQGCIINSNATCPLPQSCQASSAISGFNGACLLPQVGVNPVGHACNVNTDCPSTTGTCTQPSALPSGYNAWSNGYCTQSCEPGQPPCPAGSACYTTDTGAHECRQQCRVGLADCRPEYACSPVSTGGGVCIPRCYADADCADRVNYQCELCDGLCVARQNNSGQVGDPCVTADTCGAGQVCIPLKTGDSAKFCARQCARGCVDCPNGSVCQPLDRGDLFCVRSCTGPGTCPVGLQCATRATGKVCVGPCALDTDCAVGQSCNGGQCQDLYVQDDGGNCGDFCNQVDAGHPKTPPATDAGSGGGGLGGCGCQTVDGGLTALLLAAWVMGLSMRRPRG